MVVYDYDFPHSKMPTLIVFSFLSFALFLGLSVAIAFTTPVAADFGISAVGDWGCSSNTQQTVNNIENKNPQLVLALGDYSYQSTAKCWLDKIKPIDTKIKINIGNHEVDSKKLLNSYLDHFKLSKQYTLLISSKFMFLLCLLKQVSNQIRHSSILLIVISKKRQRILA